jgi:malonate-semialdehyde dehydrogenase (acetylating)/methylmalonate-semialdehyde dehydrogenase
MYLIITFRCMALSTAVMVGEAKEWVHDIKAKAEKLVVTAGHEPTADLGNKKTLSRHFQRLFKIIYFFFSGPLISPAAKEKVERLITSAEAAGADILLDGRNLNVSFIF